MTTQQWGRVIAAAGMAWALGLGVWFGACVLVVLATVAAAASVGALLKEVQG